MGPTWVLSAPDGPHVGPMNLAIRVGSGDNSVPQGSSISHYLNTNFTDTVKFPVNMLMTLLMDYIFSITFSFSLQVGECMIILIWTPGKTICFIIVLNYISPFWFRVSGLIVSMIMYMLLEIVIKAGFSTLMFQNIIFDTCVIQCCRKCKILARLTDHLWLMVEWSVSVLGSPPIHHLLRPCNQ